ncbi:ly6/PLAUR domain-containing protein 8-like [Mastomys coucha]|uniref:ly6/PLAUR domain-containing protein 8-like n=1 Tax=Mastomys coucha TaxID=35658 RepID=UPI00126224BB|nr:ly6/PLAUR domain-containing protein 8-like [Mastomys coucha]
MRGVFIAGIIAAFAITVVDSLDCRQCYMYNSTCEANATQCGEGYFSCVESSVNSTLGGSLHLYQNKFCSELNCTESSTKVAFTVHLFDDQRYHFASQCCQGKECNVTHDESAKQNFTNTQCMSCYGNNKTLCEQKPQQCYEGEQCVHMVAELTNGTGRVELKGCSDISNSTCQLLSKGNITVGEFIFKSVECTGSTELNLTTVTPPGINTSSATVTPPGKNTSSTTVTPSASMGIRASFTSSIFGSLLLLKLLF